MARSVNEMQFEPCRIRWVGKGKPNRPTALTIPADAPPSLQVQRVCDLQSLRL